MDDKELYEILQKYADDVKGEKESALKKLNEQPNEEVKQPHKRFKQQFALAIAMCMIVIVLCIALPITLIDNSQEVVYPTYCSSGEIIYAQEDNLTEFINKYEMDAHYPTFTMSTEEMSVCSILSKKDASLHGVQISYVIEEDDEMIFIDFAIVPRTHILQTYENYFSLQGKLKWNGYDVKSFKEYNEETLMYDMQIYFTDEIYDYFISAESDEEMDTADLLNLLYN